MSLVLQTIFLLAITLAFSLALVPVIIRYAAQTGIYDAPDEARKLHATPIPRLGGVAIVASFFISMILTKFDLKLQTILFGSFAVFFLGLIDDLRSLTPRVRIIGQAVIAMVVVYAAELIPKAIALTPNFIIQLPPEIGFLLSVFAIVGAINSINMIDGLDGLAGGVVLISVCLLTFIQFISANDMYLVAFISVPLIGAVLGFLKYNTHPASIFMGDGGSNWLGFMAGILFIFLMCGIAIVPSSNNAMTYTLSAVRSDIKVPLISIIMCIAVPILDTAAVMISRLLSGLSPFAADRRHFHHTLLRLGLGHAEAVSAVYFVALSAGIIGVLPVIYPRLSFDWLPYLGAITLALFIGASTNFKSTLLEELLTRRAKARSKVSYDFISKAIVSWDALNRLVLMVILIGGPIFVGQIPATVGYAAFCTAFCLIVASISTLGKQDEFIDTLVLSLGAIVLLTANNTNLMKVQWLGKPYDIQYIYNGLYVFLALSAVLMILVTAKRRYFVFTPSDFLLLTLPLLTLLVPDPWKSQLKLEVIALRSIVVFMVVRAQVKRRVGAVTGIRLGIIISLIFVGLVGVFGLKPV